MPSKPKHSHMPKLAPGVLLIPEPFLTDTHFKRSVVLVAGHDNEGTLGLILNKPSELKLNDGVDDFPEFDVPLYFGGPVDNDMLFYVHTLGNVLPESTLIKDGLWWGGNYDKLKVMIDTKQITSNQIRFFAGYCGWSCADMKQEMEERSWMVYQKNVKELCFWKENPRNMWSWVLKSMGNEYAILANFPEDPSLN